MTAMDFDSVCPGCGTRFDRTTHSAGKPRPPKEGDVSVCTHCATPAQFRRRDDNRLTLEIVEPPYHPVLKWHIDRVLAQRVALGIKRRRLH